MAFPAIYSAPRAARSGVWPTQYVVITKARRVWIIISLYLANVLGSNAAPCGLFQVSGQGPQQATVSPCPLVPLPDPLPGVCGLLTTSLVVLPAPSSTEPPLRPVLSLSPRFRSPCLTWGPPPPLVSLKSRRDVFFSPNPTTQPPSYPMLRICVHGNSN